MISFDKDSIRVDYSEHSGNVVQITVTYSYCDNSNRVNAPISSDWITLYQYGGLTTVDTVITYSLHIDESDDVARQGSIIFSYTDDDDIYQSVAFTDIWQGSGEFVYGPIWKDVEYIAQGRTSFNYSIRKDGEAFYYGQAKNSNDGSSVSFNVNRPCIAYMDNSLDILSTGVTSNGAFDYFELVDDNDVCIMNYAFIDSWDGDWASVFTSNLSSPINGHADPRMRVLCTLYNNQSRAINYTIE